MLLIQFTNCGWTKTVLYKLVLANLLNMWLTKLPYFRFSTITKQDHLMLFASYPVGYPMLKKLHENYSNMHVVTHFTKPNQNATNQVETYCKKSNISYYTPVIKQTSKEERQKGWKEFQQKIKSTNINFKLGIVCAYGYMIPSNIISLFEKGVILAHPSLIPKYRGGSPIFHVIANGELQSGASFMEVSADKFDHGNLLYQVKCNIGEKDSYQEVEAQLSNLMAQQIMQVIQNVDTLRPGKNQSEMDVSQIPPHQLEAKIIKQKNLNVHMRAVDVYNWSRALSKPRVKFNNDQILVFFEKQFLEDSQNSCTPGQLRLKGKSLYMKCQDKFLKLKAWQQISKKALPIHTFINRFIDRSTYKDNFFLK